MSEQDDAGIGHHDRRLLAALAERGGTTASQVAHETGWDGSLRSAVQIVRRELDALCRRGLARRMDDQRPTCWLRTAEGTAALGEGESGR